MLSSNALKYKHRLLPSRWARFGALIPTLLIALCLFSLFPSQRVFVSLFLTGLACYLVIARKLTHWQYVAFSDDGQISLTSGERTITGTIGAGAKVTRWFIWLEVMSEGKKYVEIIYSDALSDKAFRRLARVILLG